MVIFPLKYGQLAAKYRRIQVHLLLQCGDNYSVGRRTCLKSAPASTRRHVRSVRPFTESFRRAAGSALRYVTLRYVTGSLARAGDRRQ